MKNATALTLLAATLFTGSAAMADAPRGEEHSVTVKIKKTTLPPTMILVGHHRSCQKDKTLRDMLIDVHVSVHSIDGIERDKKLELEAQYEKIVVPLFRDNDNVTRDDIQNTLKKFMDETASIHFEFRVGLAHVLPYDKDPCTNPELSARLSP